MTEKTFETNPAATELAALIQALNNASAIDASHHIRAFCDNLMEALETLNDNAIHTAALTLELELVLRRHRGLPVPT